MAIAILSSLFKLGEADNPVKPKTIRNGKSSKRKQARRDRVRNKQRNR